MATSSNSSSAADTRPLPILGGALVARHSRRCPPPVEIPLGPAPCAWSRAALLLILVAVPGSMNLATLLLPFLLVMGRLRRVRVWHARICA